MTVELHDLICGIAVQAVAAVYGPALSTGRSNR